MASSGTDFLSIQQQMLLTQQQSLTTQLQTLAIQQQADEDQRLQRERERKQQESRKKLESNCSKATNKAPVCDKERQATLFYNAYTKCDPMSPFLFSGYKPTEPKEIATLRERHAQCDQWKKQYEELNKVCASFK